MINCSSLILTFHHNNIYAIYITNLGKICLFCVYSAISNVLPGLSIEPLTRTIPIEWLEATLNRESIHRLQNFEQSLLRYQLKEARQSSQRLAWQGSAASDPGLLGSTIYLLVLPAREREDQDVTILGRDESQRGQRRADKYTERKGRAEENKRKSTR